MRLLYITTRISGAGGVQRVLSAKTDYLVKKGYDITIAVTNIDDDKVLYDFNSQIKIVTVFPNRNRLFYFSSYKKLIRKLAHDISPDIVIVCDNGLKGFLIPMILKKYPLIYERHLTRFVDEKQSNTFFNKLKNNITDTFIRYMASKFDSFVLLTKTAYKEWSLDNKLIIPNPLWFQTQNFSPLKKKIAIAVGRHTYQKGYDRMFEIWAKIVEKYPDWILKVYGKANDDYDIAAMAEKNGIVENVVFEDIKTDILQTYQEASVFLLTSYWEGFGMVLVEAMACGVPCVAYDCPVGPSDIIIDGFNGYLIKDGDLDTFADRLSLIIENQEQREVLGTQAKDIIKKFDLDAVMEKWETLFKRTVK